MQRLARPSPQRGRPAMRAKRFPTSHTTSPIRGRCNRVQKSDSCGRGSRRGPRGKRIAKSAEYARDVTAAPLPGLQTFSETLHRPNSISACSDASLEFIRLCNLETDEDTNIVTLNLMDYFLFSPENWLPDLSYCKLHAACFLFASRLTEKNNTVEQIADALGPDSSFVQLVGSPLADGEEAAAEIQYTISVVTSDVEDGYSLLWERREMFVHLLGAYSAGLDGLPIPSNYNDEEKPAVDQDEKENFDTFEAVD